MSHEHSGPRCATNTNEGLSRKTNSNYSSHSGENSRKDQAIPVETANDDTDGFRDSLVQRTDAGNATRFAREHGDDIKHCRAIGWLAWSGSHWQREADAEVERHAKDTARGIFDEASREPDDDRRKARLRHAALSNSLPGIRGMMELAKSELEIAITADQFDSDPWLLNVANGTLDLRTGVHHPHRREDFITRCCRVKHDQAATAPRWEQFVSEIMGHDEELVRFLQQILGYALTGDKREQCFFFLYGSGANGKSTLLKIMQELLEGYAAQANPETFMEKSRGQIRNDVARLAGVRFVAANETAQGSHLDEAAVKQLTGDDTYTARFLYKEHFEFAPQFKLFMAGNHKPTLRGTDLAIRRRIHLIPFSVAFHGNRRDRTLLNALRAEFPGILNWLVRGCLEWQQDGLEPPRSIAEATTEYLDAQDPLGDFLKECCVVGDGLSVAFFELFAAFEEWCSRGQHGRIGKRGFAEALEGRGFSNKHQKVGNYRLGIALRSQEVPIGDVASNNVKDVKD